MLRPELITVPEDNDLQIKSEDPLIKDDAWSAFFSTSLTCNNDHDKREDPNGLVPAGSSLASPTTTPNLAVGFVMPHYLTSDLGPFYKGGALRNETPKVQLAPETLQVRPEITTRLPGGGDFHGSHTPFARKPVDDYFDKQAADCHKLMASIQEGVHTMQMISEKLAVASEGSVRSRSSDNFIHHHCDQRNTDYITYHHQYINQHGHNRVHHNIDQHINPHGHHQVL